MQIFVSAILAQPNRYICFRNTASVSSANWKISFNRSSFHEPLHKCTLQEDKKEMIEKKKKKKKRKEKFEYNKTLWEYYGMNGRGRGGGGEGLKVWKTVPLPKRERASGVWCKGTHGVICQYEPSGKHVLVVPKAFYLIPVQIDQSRLTWPALGEESHFNFCFGQTWAIITNAGFSKDNTYETYTSMNWINIPVPRYSKS